MITKKGPSPILLLRLSGEHAHLTEHQCEMLSRQLAEVFGADKFVQGRASANSNAKEWALEILPKLTEDQAVEWFSDKRFAGLHAFMGEKRVFVGQPGEQLVQVKLRGPVYTENAPLGDWTIVAMMRDWAKSMKLDARFVYGADHEDISLEEMDDARYERLLHQFLTSGTSGLISPEDGSDPYHVDPIHAENASRLHSAQCATCDQAMMYLGDYNSSPACKVERHECPHCGERMALSLPPDGGHRAYWMGNSDTVRVEGIVTWVPNPMNLLAVQKLATEEDPLQRWPTAKVVAYFRSQREALNGLSPALQAAE